MPILGFITDCPPGLSGFGGAFMAEPMERPAAGSGRVKSRRPRWGLIVCILLTFLLALGLTALGLWFFGYEKVYLEAWNTMPQNSRLTLHQQPDGSILLKWPHGAGSDYYSVTLWQGDIPEPPLESDETAPTEPVLPFFTKEVSGTLECVLPACPQGQEMTIQIRSYARYDTLSGPAARPGQEDLIVKGVFDPPVIDRLICLPDPDTDRVSLRYHLSPNQTCQLKISLDGLEETWALETGKRYALLEFGDGETFPMPSFAQTYHFEFSSYIETDQYFFQGLPTAACSLTREDLLGTELKLNRADEGHNLYTLTWNETKGDHYEVQRYDAASDSWTTLIQIPRDGELRYSTGHLDRYSDYRFRVIAVGDAEVTPDETSFSTGASLIYSTIWPLQDLTIYDDPLRTNELGTAPKATAYCILDEENGMFRIRFPEGEGWIDSNYCMINLPEFIGNICKYNITNSYKSAYLVHGYAIDSITGKTVKGYEDVALSGGSFLVPLLYPTALKLEKAAFAALEKGYQLKIYDSYRPGKASQAVRDATEKILKNPLPEETYENIQIDDMPQVEEDQELTYNDLMTDFGRYSIGAFIAPYGSRHNLGIALDLTLINAGSGRELKMQSLIHDLSHYAERSRNKYEANLLSKFMTEAGFGTLTSEWWHFQDNEALQNLKLELLWEGVSAKGWVADDHGWRYRRAGGTFYVDCTRTIDDKEYTFDAQGYVVQSSESDS